MMYVCAIQTYLFQAQLLQYFPVPTYMDMKMQINMCHVMDMKMQINMCHVIYILLSPLHLHGYERAN
jgi:hypothetical protein